MNIKGNRKTRKKTHALVHVLPQSADIARERKTKKKARIFRPHTRTTHAAAGPVEENDGKGTREEGNQRKEVKTPASGLAAL